MSSPDAPGRSLAMASPQDAVAPSSDAPAKQIRIDIKNKDFTLFMQMPQNIRDLVWDETIEDCAQPGINFFQVYDCTNLEDGTLVDYLRLDKNSKVAMLARLKRTCKDLKEAIDRYYLVASNKGERFTPITVNTHSGETRVLVNVDDIVSFASITEGEFHERAGGFPIKPGNAAFPRAFLGYVTRPPVDIGCRLEDADAPDRPHLLGEWNWIRRVAITYPLACQPTEHVALAGHNVVKIRNRQSRVPCYPCIAWSLSGLRNLEEVFFVVKEVSKPRKKNRPQSIRDSPHALHDVYCLCAQSLFEEVLADPEDLESNDQEGSASSEDEDTDLPQLDQLSIGPVSGATQEENNAHHSLKHFALHFVNCANLRIERLNEAPRPCNVNFKLLSHKAK
ncbi:hypothetical protein SLS53_007909 [Cytospora paraplurivora]|uniref:Uncharacterized protein n=1 Tax=Cytospora paraplurivora TaxID=2898453 RepID=A0AAN9U210_9PEZI